MNESDHELMRRTAQGEADAFAALVGRWEEKVLRVLLRLAPNRHEAEDLRQEVFLKALAASGRYRAQGQFSTWLFCIVLNVARDAARRRRSHTVLPASLAADEESPREKCWRRELIEGVEAALAALPESQREVIVLKHYGELTFDEVAQATGLPASTVKSRVHAGLRKLRAELRRRGFDEK